MKNNFTKCLIIFNNCRSVKLLKVKSNIFNSEIDKDRQIDRQRERERKRERERERERDQIKGGVERKRDRERTQDRENKRERERKTKQTNIRLSEGWKERKREGEIRG